jgi:hypothetical protein
LPAKLAFPFLIEKFFPKKMLRYKEAGAEFTHTLSNSAFRYI